MKVIIAGCGRVGAFLANRLSMEGHDVSIIDKDPTSFEHLGKTFKGQTIRGYVFDKDALKKAGIEHADAFISVTSGDNSNVVSATIAKDIYKVPKVVARIYEPRRAEIYRRLGIPTVSSVTWASNEILTLMLHADIIREMSFGDGEVQLARIIMPPRLIGRTVEDISITGEIQVVAIVRNGKSFIPTKGTVFEKNDLVEIVTLTTALPKLKNMLAP